ncbi:hypothetical protein [Streptomyces sp. NPDC058861]|uniref:hypothetical protein n=1 Tax=Streptomyces sp. NPDC058861 TaxID=3346653 RepID=UPI0036BFB4CF
MTLLTDVLIADDDLLTASPSLLSEIRIDHAVTPPRGGRSGARFDRLRVHPLPRRQQITPFFYQQRPLLCGVCLARFRPANAVVLPVHAAGEDA